MAQFDTLRLGRIEIPPSEQIEFKRGLLGFDQLRLFAHMQLADEAPFEWLQSLEKPQVAFVVVNPALFFPSYRIEIDPRELGEVRPGPNERLLVRGICRMAESFADISVNLLGPIVVNTATRQAKQLVLNRSGYRTQHRLADGETTPATRPPQPSALRPGSVRAAV